MNFEAPLIENISQVLPVVKDNPAFVVKDKGFYTVIDYVYMSDKLFHNPIERECRGIKFCSVTGKILARPYHKFHNLGEREAFMPSKVDLRQNHVVLDKLDGSMVHTCASKLGIYLMTRMGITEVATKADEFLNKNQIKYSRLFNSLGVDDYTYIFEYVGPGNKIVLDYKEEDLILTGIRHTVMGTYVLHNQLVALGKAFGIKVVDHYPVDAEFKLDISDWDENIKLAFGVEGAVIRFDSGEMIKIKSEDYCRKHNSKELASSFKGLVGLIIDNKLDDVLPQLEEPQLSKVKAYAAKLDYFLSETSKNVLKIVDESRHLDQKSFALEVVCKNPPALSPLLFNVRKGDTPYQTVLNAIRKNISTNSKLTEYFTNMGYPIWNCSFFGEE